MKMRDRTGRLTADVADEAVEEYRARGWRPVEAVSAIAGGRTLADGWAKVAAAQEASQRSDEAAPDDHDDDG